MDVKRNELIMMTRRGYDVSLAYIYSNPNVFPFKDGVNELTLQNIVDNHQDMSMVYPKDNRRTLVLYLPVVRGKTRKDAEDVVCEAINRTADGRPMFNDYIFFSGELTPTIRKNLNDLRIDMTMFTYLEMSIDVFSHVTAPLSVKWWTDSESFYRDESIKDLDLPQIRVSDPYIRRLGLKRGYIIMAVLPGIIGNTIVDYRVVVA